MTGSQRAREQRSAAIREAAASAALAAARIRRRSQPRALAVAEPGDDMSTPPPGHPAWRGLTGPDGGQR